VEGVFNRNDGNIVKLGSLIPIWPAASQMLHQTTSEGKNSMRKTTFNRPDAAIRTFGRLRDI
jgi:hypothetical protein